jgi:AcrR family transcriptional regulator
MAKSGARNVPLTSPGPAGGKARNGPQRPAAAPPSAAPDPPRRPSRKSESTRKRLLHAARTVFERDGFFEARVSDIAVEAGVSHGTFYTHFTDKTDVFKAVVVQSDDELNQEMLTIPAELAHDFRASLMYSNRRFFDNFQRLAALHRAIAEATAADPDFRELRIAARQEHIRKVAHTIERWQSRGQADKSLDPMHTAAALVCMMAEYASLAFVWDREYDVDEMTRVTTLMWLRTVTADSDHPVEV